jgi:NitT/TauT family transport system substrate-binding protein
MGRAQGAILLVMALALALAGCAPAATPAKSVSDVTIAMGYIPNVQFAPFYIAQEKGYFAAEGLNVKFDYGFEADLIKLLASDKVQFVVGSGDQVILARAQGLPIVYVLQWFRQFPVSVVSLAEKGIVKPADLVGKSVGTPMLAGASYVGWKALVQAAGLPEAKISLQAVGYAQLASLTSGKVDAAICYIANEPVQLRALGRPVNEILVSDYADIVSNGLLTNEKSVKERPALVGALARALQKGIRDAVANPTEAFEICLKAVPEAGGDNRALQEAVLKRSIELWRTEQIGVSQRASWVASQDYMARAGLIDTISDVDKMFTNQFVGGK